jgi:large subunit ribosomal protein L31e
MAALERTYTIPLRREYLKAPMYNRTKKAVRALRAFIVKHMKSDDVLIGPKLNLKLWERGRTNPPHHVKITAIKDDKGQVRAELFGFEFKPKEKKEKKEKPAPGLAGKLAEKLGSTEEKKGEPKEIKSDKKEMKKAEKKEVTEKKETPAKKPKA